MAQTAATRTSHPSLPLAEVVVEATAQLGIQVRTTESQVAQAAAAELFARRRVWALNSKVTQVDLGRQAGLQAMVEAEAVQAGPAAQGRAASTAALAGLVAQQSTRSRLGARSATS